MARLDDNCSNALFETLEDWESYLKAENIKFPEPDRPVRKQQVARAFAMSAGGLVGTLPKTKSEFSAASKASKKLKKKSPRVTLRFTEEEYAKLVLAADGVSLSAYIRSKLFGENVSLRKSRSRVPVVDQRVLAQILGQLGQSDISDSLTQIAYEASCGSLLLDQQTEQEIKLACAQIAWIRVKLIEALCLKAK